MKKFMTRMVSQVTKPPCAACEKRRAAIKAAAAKLTSKIKYKGKKHGS